ncbi:MAG: BACON domain-containing carbohydrate-binding protein [Bryobacteraceae bacterium]
MHKFVFLFASILAAAPAVDRLPAHFEPNQGQGSPWASFVSRGSGYDLELSASQARLRTRSGVVTMRLAGASPDAKATALDPLEGKVSYFDGSDRSKWRAGIPAYRRVKVEQVYPGIDLIYYGNRQELEYDFVIAPGADPGAVELAFEDARSVRVAQDGALTIETEGGPVQWRKPVLYQGSGEGRREVTGGYEVGEGGRVRFRVGEYDRSRELVIDPVLEYVNWIPEGLVYKAMAVDSAGSVYLASPDWAGRPSIMKLNPAGTDFTYLAYIGGHGTATAIVLDPSGNAFLGGTTTFTDIPAISAGQVFGTLPAGDFVFGVNASGTQPIFSVSVPDPTGGGIFLLAYDPVGNQILLLKNYHRYLDRIRIPDGTRTRFQYASNHYVAGGVAADPASGELFLAGTVYRTNSTGQPSLQPVNGSSDCFISRFARDGTSFRFTETVHFGGSGDEDCNSIAFSGAFIYAIGATYQGPANPSTYRIGAGTSFIARINRDLTGNPTYLVSGDFRTFAIDGGKIYVGGTASSSGLAVGSSLKPGIEGLGGTIGISGDSGSTWSPAYGFVGQGNSIAIDPQNPGRVYAVFDQLGVRSDDSGRSWTSFTGGREIAISSDGSRVYVGLASGFLAVYSSSGPALVAPRSVLPASLFGSPRPHADPSNPLVAYVAQGGIARTADGGVTWTKLRDDVTNGLAIHPLAPSTLWAATSTGLIRSVDTGATWIGSVAGLPSGSVQDVVVARSNPNVLYCLAANRVYRSNNGGVNWILANGGLPNIDVYENSRRLTVSPSNPDTVYLASPYGAFRTVNGGASWAAIGAFGGRQVTAIVTDPVNPANLFATTDIHYDLFVGRLTLDGQPEWITYFGGRDNEFFGTLSAQSGSVYFAGDSYDPRSLPSTASASYREQQSFIAKIGNASPASCAYQVRRTSQDSIGGTGTITIISPPGCAWAATTSDSWIFLPPGSSGTGTGSVKYWLEANPGASRAGSIRVAGSTIPIQQGSADCTYTFDPPSRTLGTGAGTETVSLLTQTGCPWDIALSGVGNRRGWAVSPVTGAGSSTISYSFPADPDQSEFIPSAVGVLGGGSFLALHQLSRTNVACTARVSSSSVSFAASGGTSSIDLNIPYICSRTPSTSATWLTVTPETSTGPGKLTLKSAPNLSSSPRTATVTIAGAAISVTQAGNCGPGLCSFAGPIISNPSPALTIGVSGVTFQWGAINGVAGYQMRITQGGSLVFEGTLLGSGATSTLVSLPHAQGYTFGVRGCVSQPFADASCGAFSTVDFNVSLPVASPPTILAPTANQFLDTSTQTFRWSAVAGAQSYEIDLTSFERELSMTVFGAGGNPPPTETVYSMHSGYYTLRVRACVAACGDWSAPVSFSVTLPAVPTVAPNTPTCTLNTNRLNCNWNSVTNADIYVIQAVNPTAGPGGGALTVASRQVPTPTVSDLLVPTGPIAVFVAACNGNGCGPYSAPAQLTVTAANPVQPVLGSPVPGSQVTSNPVFFSWSRIPGDNGSNTLYRLFVQDLSRGATGLDVLTRSNFYSAAFKGEGSRYDAVVVANPDTPQQVIGPAAGFVVRAENPASPTMVEPRHQQPGVDSTVAAGNVLLGWGPVPGASLYEYFVARPGQSNPVARGVTPGLFVQVPVPAVGSAPTVYNGIVRACSGGVPCTFGSEANWGPWSNAAGGPGVTSFTVR